MGMERRLNGFRDRSEINVWTIIDRLMMRLGKQWGTEARIWLGDLISPHKATGHHTAIVKTLLQLYPLLFPEAEWVPINLVTGYRRKQKGVFIVFRRRLQPEKDPYSQLLMQVMGSECPHTA